MANYSPAATMTSDWEQTGQAMQAGLNICTQ
jgi:hypothetical protein